MTKRKNTIRGATHHVHVCKCAFVWCCREAACAHRGNIYSDDPKFPKDNPNCERCAVVRVDNLKNAMPSRGVESSEPQCPACGADVVFGGSITECAARCGWQISRADAG